MGRDDNRLETLLAERGVLVADGAMGTTLFSYGLESGGCPELLNVERPDLIRRVHTEFVEAGSDIVLTNTFGGTRRRLALHGLEHRVAELNAAGVSVARQVAEAADRPVVVAASIGPTGDLFEPLGPLSHEAGVEAFVEQIEAVAGAGADVAWIETMSSFEELDAAVEAADKVGLPAVATLSFDTRGRTMMGITPGAVGGWWAGREHRPLAVGANCGVGPGDSVAAVYDIVGVAPDAVAVAKANCGMPLFETDRLIYPIGPDGMAEYVELAVRSGARIIGACCGSTPAHIAAVRRAVDAGVPDGRPERDEIERRLDAHALSIAGTRRQSRRR